MCFGACPLIPVLKIGLWCQGVWVLVWFIVFVSVSPTSFPLMRFQGLRKVDCEIAQLVFRSSPTSTHSLLVLTFPKPSCSPAPGVAVHPQSMRLRLYCPPRGGGPAPESPLPEGQCPLKEEAGR